jgi:L-arabinose isomerase
MIGATRPDIWLVCGSQHLYGPGPLEEVAANARHLAATLDGEGAMPLPVRFRAVVTTPDEVGRTCLEANADPTCAGLILWMHTFSPARRCGSPASRRWRSRSATCTPSTTATSPGTRSTWTS